MEPEGASPFSSVLPTPQAIPISNFRPLYLFVFILWSFEFFRCNLLILTKNIVLLPQNSVINVSSRK